MLYSDLPKPFFVLAPMDDVTDTVFRQLIATTAPPDLFFTEFVNVDALQSAGRLATMPRLLYTKSEKPLIAQIWGKNPENYYKTAIDLVAMGFDGIDINMGCPVKDVVKNGCCSALMNNRERAKEIIQAVKEGGGNLPISVKTRLGFNDIDYTWHELLLKQKLNMLSIHARTRKQMSKVPANWDAMGHIVKLRDKIAIDTKIVGNGDVLSLAHGQELVNKHNLDGIMIGRGVFNDPFVFASEDIWKTYSPRQRKDLYAKHVKLFARTWKNNEKPLVVLNKFCKIYISGFEGAKELREHLMSAKTTDELIRLLK